MALTTGATPQPARTREQPDREPYFRRLEPLDGGYNLAHDSGRPIGRIRVFDDRDEAESIHVQFMQGQAYGAKVAVMHFDTLAEYDELIDALSQAREQMRATARAKKAKS